MRLPPTNILILALPPVSASAIPQLSPQTPLFPTVLDRENPRIQNGLPLLILPLGNSITWGYGSTSGNGYRQPLLDALSPPNPVTFIGSQHSGNMSNNANEGHPGAIIDQIAIYADSSLYLKPNLILLMAGTNDMAANVEPDTAPERLGNLIDECVEACPDAVLLVAQLTPMLGDGQVRLRAFNDAVPGVVANRTASGKKILVVDMEAFVTTAELEDGLHPNDVGYEAMARGWVGGIREAAIRGWIVSAGGAEAVNRSGNGTLVFTGGAGKARSGIWVATWLAVVMFVMLYNL